MPTRFHDFELDEARFELTRAGRPVPLRPKAFDLLAYLVRHRGRVVRREELVGAVWGTTRVGMGSLSGLVNEVRQALGEAAGADSSIRTVHARGYRFVAPVLPVGTDAGRVRDAPEEGDDGMTGRASSVASGPRAIGGDDDRSDAGAAGLADPFVRVSERGAWGLLVEAAPDPGGDRRSERVTARERNAAIEGLVERAEETGFEIWEIVAPHEAMATAGRLASDLLVRALTERSRKEVLAALPLPARVGVDESTGAPVAGGESAAPGGPVAGGEGAAPGGPVGGLSAIASMLARLARRRPILLVVHAVAEAGAVYAADVGRLVRELGTAPMLVAVPSEGAEANAGAARLRRQLLGRAGFDAWRPRTLSEADTRHRPLSDWLRRRDLPPLPREVEHALLEHFLGERSERFESVSGVESEDGPALERVRVRRVEPRPKGNEARRKA